MIGDLLPDEKTAFAALQHSQKADLVHLLIPAERDRLYPYLLSMLFQISYSLTNCGNGLSLLIRNRDIEFFFEFHDQFYSVERVCSQVICERSFISYLCFVNA